MKNLLTLALLFFFICNRISADPLMPPIYYVTINPETQLAEIVWYNSNLMFDINHYVDYYKVLETRPSPAPGQPPFLVEISDEIVTDPVNGGDTTYTISTLESLTHSIGYSVISYKDMGIAAPLRSIHSGPDSTIFLQAVYDSCLNQLSLSWNDYNSWRGSIGAFEIYRRNGPNDYSLIQTLPEGTNNLVLPGLTLNMTYDLFVVAVHEDDINRRSASNRVVIHTQAVLAPAFINADYATLGTGNGIDLSFTIDATSLTNFRLLKSNELNGSYAAIDSFSFSGSRYTFTDEVPFTSGVFYYRLEILNNCNRPALRSNAANNIIVTGNMADMVISLQWNEYEDWEGDVQNYRVIRTIGSHNPVTDTLENGLSTVFTDNLNGRINYENPSEGLICYSVTATENRNIFGIQGKSFSNRICFSVNPDVRIPNAFIPNDGDPVNQVFEPVFSILPESYTITIYNRLGTKIWEGSEPWNGRAGGMPVPEGVYLYYIRVNRYSGSPLEFNGKVTVLYR